MNTTEIIAALDSEISRLQKVRDLISSDEGAPRSRKAQGVSESKVDPAVGSAAPQKRGPGRPKGSVNKAGGSAAGEAAPKRGTMSAEGRERIAAAQRARWAKRNGAAAPAKASKAPGRPAKTTETTQVKRPVGRPPKSASLKGTESKKTAGKATATKVPAKAAPKPAKKPSATPSSPRGAAKKESPKKSAAKQTGTSSSPAVNSPAVDANGNG